MFVVFTSPNQVVRSYNEAVQIADAHYNLTGEIVAVELSTNHATPWRTINNY